MYGYYQQPGRRNEWIKSIFFGRNVLSRLILINTAIFLLTAVVHLFTWLFGIHGPYGLTVLGSFLALPSDLHKLALMPWTVFTYMFLHEGLFHWLFNMIMLYFGGILFTEYLSQRKLLKTYILGGLAGAFFFVAAFNIFPVFTSIRQNAVALGASASILAIIVAISTYVPNYTVQLFLLGRVKLKWLAIAFVLLDILSIPSDNPGGHIAHLGGALYGFLWALSLRNGKDLFSLFDRLNFPDINLQKRKYKRFDTSRPASGRPMTDEEYNRKKAATQAEIDRILDKISHSGYASLTKAEKELLFKSSKKNH
ncbi:rhomboid family intramembrane serine protease [Candidatus Sulfidibacterium hydrothermale]|uniref:rhomboid family intramembrane serine protease n=1 Tax=Candidatus Sulfidibacterium hydrothermale TaxID=2875962 RepID=UPI001F0B6510|nr:rhomboid family intramembrane serine protease [Candidatus Sulfidibacterium hydrothermale]UBM61055.1 rhomboid family intramembrane serine protease [Candidatus Sulfidibacterium hydrothermale]